MSGHIYNVSGSTAQVFGRHTLQAKTSTSKYECMWASYHSFSTDPNLVEMWSAALETTSNAPYFPLFVQLAIRKVMEGAVLIVFPKKNLDMQIRHNLY